MKTKSWVHDPKHPLWLLIRQAVVLLPLGLFLAFGYQNGWSPKDLVALITAGAALGIFDVAKKAMTAKLPDMDPDIDKEA